MMLQGSGIQGVALNFIYLQQRSVALGRYSHDGLSAMTYLLDFAAAWDPSLRELGNTESVCLFPAPLREQISVLRRSRLDS